LLRENPEDSFYQTLIPPGLQADKCIFIGTLNSDVRIKRARRFPLAVALLPAGKNAGEKPRLRCARQSDCPDLWQYLPVSILCNDSPRHFQFPLPRAKMGVWSAIRRIDATDGAEASESGP
jgi:hypothetical protein